MSGPFTYQQALTEAEQVLSHLDEPALEARWLVGSCLNLALSQLIAWPDKTLSDSQRQRFVQALSRRSQGEPLAYITGEKEFWSLPLQVSPVVLIPRPDTEVIVEYCLSQLSAVPAPSCLDLGTGSGAIALALASELPQANIVASDSSAEALAVATNNARRLNLAVTFKRSHWFDSLPTGQRYDLIVSNPPYIDAGDPHLRGDGVCFEPVSALVAPHQGMADLQQLAVQSSRWLVTGGILVLEHGWQQGPDVEALLAAQGFVDIEAITDYGSRRRGTAARSNRP